MNEIEKAQLEIAQKAADNLQQQNARQAVRIRALEKALRFYATESHVASDDGKHNRLHFEDCDHPDCTKARKLLAGAS